ncbi:electron transport complex subunit RsxC [Shewanella youngdeokensis]|uniref:Ion-translocating oxidoreductase complex subunit C n=1 Tax=Shewanella youngdeokensis TaxID=2999068 RepID=A0ABZ0K460_9GAMM|nr:electron transport complex subunit RsxC [Shewanella sp. DAU334]
MLTLLEQIDKGMLWRSHGGIHPPELKSLSNKTAIATLPLAQQFVLPIPQVGESALLNVKLGDYVLKGQALTSGTSFAHCPVHAPTSGQITAIKPMPSNHASGIPVLSCILTADGLNNAVPATACDASTLTNQQILQKIQQAGIAGLGGAAFPTHIKLSPASVIELVIINGIECEPYITSDDRLMQQHSDEIVAGIAIIERLLSPKRIVIAIEDNKPEAIDAMQHSLNRSELNGDNVRVTPVPTKYPSGGEKQLIQILTGQEVPSGAIPAQLGMLVQNVGTAYAIQDAVSNGKPLTERVVTVTGLNSNKPGNYWVPIGTPVEHILKTSGFKGKLTQDKVIIGGPMMGHELPNIDAPVLKGTNCVLLPSDSEISSEQPEKPCIRCGECAVVCPALLLPQQLFWHSQAQEFDKAASFNLRDCIECGCCSYVCPSDIPLVEYFRVAKSALRTEAEEKKQADLAKQRFDAKQQRLEDEKIAREAKAKEAAERRKQSMTGTAKNAVAEAMARIKAKNAADAVASVNEPPADDKKAQVAAAIARAKAKKGATALTTDAPADDKKAKINAAIARAKAKKAQHSSSAAEEVAEVVDDKQAKIAAAIARAKAKKQQQAASSDKTTPTSTLTASETLADTTPEVVKSPAEVKKARVAAAIAKAKAKKMTASDENNSDSALVTANIEATVQHNTDTTTDLSNTEPTDNVALSAAEQKKARIAAAVAKAKAKKMTASDENNSGSALVTANIETTAQHNTDTTTDLSNTEPAENVALSAAEQKKARIAAAVAKAKAKKMTASDENNSGSALVTANIEASVQHNTDTTTELSNTEPADSVVLSAAEQKKARIAAAVAKAKAKKAQATLQEKD